MSDITMTLRLTDWMKIRMALDAKIYNMSGDIAAMLSVPDDERGEDFTPLFETIFDRRESYKRLLADITAAMKPPENPYLNQ